MTDAGRAANLKRRIFMLRYHIERRGADGKSVVAQRGGHARMGADRALARAIATEMAVKRWHGAGDGGQKLPDDGSSSSTT